MILNFTQIIIDRVHIQSKAKLFVILAVFMMLCISPLLLTPCHAACTDNDGDGYGVGYDCSGPDCDDNNAQIHPGAAEKCNSIDDDCNGQIDESFILGRESKNSSSDDCGDGVDNDGDGDIDDDDPDCQSGYCFLFSPTGCSYTPGSECCPTRAFYECNASGTGTTCPVPPGGLNEPSPEEPYTQSCHDEVDNDCDQNVDGDDSGSIASEVCNSLDDDYDSSIDEDFICSTCNTGVNVGDTCTVGVGGCERTGIVICLDDSTAGCSAAPGTPKSENTPGTGNCVDGKDNDCDGCIDLGDSGCQTAEKCDGIDNDGDGLVDEGFDKNAPCDNGLQGSCYAEGNKICSPDGTTTICNAVAPLANPEGPTGDTCYDGVDNNCNGLTDFGDPGCSSANLAVSCSLPYTHGKPGNDCTGKHQILFSYSGAAEDAEVTAELLALDVNGEVLASLPVKNGDYAHLASRLNPIDFRAVTNDNKHRTEHTVFAPVPLLRVTVKDAFNKASAYCSNIPYLEVVEPSGTVVSESEGNVTPVLAAIPLVNPSSLSIKIDGVNILSALGKTGTDCTPAIPCSGTVIIGGQNVMVSDLIVSSAPVDQNASNTVSMKLSNLSCGGHIVVINGTKRPGSFPLKPAAPLYR